jgi:hypothetical protein
MFLDLNIHSRKLMLDWLRMIGDILNPRKNWANSDLHTDREMQIWLRRLFDEALTITSEKFTMPIGMVEAEHADFSFDKPIVKDRKFIKKLLNANLPSPKYEILRDCRLRYLYSEQQNCIVFVSNVVTDRIYSIADYHNSPKIGFAHVPVNGGMRQEIIVDFIEMTPEYMENERENRRIEEQASQERADAIVFEMQHYPK